MHPIDLVLIHRFSEIAQYLDNWLREYGHMFVSCVTDEYQSYGQSTTCRVEAQHALLKLYLGTAQSNLNTLLISIDKILISQKSAIQETFNRSKNEKMNKCDIPIFSELWYNISKHAFTLMHKELLQTKFAAEDCNHQLRSIYGLPCFCQMMGYRIHGKYIKVNINECFHGMLPRNGFT